MSFTAVQEQFAQIASNVRFDEPMSEHTTFKIGGPAEIWFEPESEEQLQHALQLAAEQTLPITVIGGGANVLVSDAGIQGLVINMGAAAFNLLSEVDATLERGVLLYAGASLPLESLVRKTQRMGLAGVEFLAGVPGRVGGATRMNAGTHDDAGEWHAFSDVLVDVHWIDFDGTSTVLKKEDIAFAYRSSSLKTGIVTGVTLTLIPEDESVIKERVDRLWDYKKATQDWSAPSVGCIFKNPEGYSAGQLIDEAGLKGHRIGGAAFSGKHANFIVNVDNASAADVHALIVLAQDKIRTAHNVELELEVQVVGA